MLKGLSVSLAITAAAATWSSTTVKAQGIPANKTAVAGIEVWGKLVTNVLAIDNIPDEGIIAVVGKRTLVIDPVQVRHGETIGDDTP